ncbi:hypothetical protein C1752_01135 [Acaryochloris thomasi RCC1774]|uniref:Filamentous haemagglutinin FhaB/tRNA nuclease CdiA-like TPS domain-containing protein n=1 Tax=Acaryochloris thomasi RCC1774 TaxID=1764569 RepID=A0A2W1JL37_9CYAN|nr:filamentous hemagglutinin N-terminal domain-containing protein [Acaryochloris thomasi]PZD74079.1 hypothetical protein C1752_01135 [Acaryochloris thomasi RCC1774]
MFDFWKAFFALYLVILFDVSLAEMTCAQVFGDTTLPVRTVVSDTGSDDFTITGGTLIGGQNLFHSFKKFSVPPGKSVVFRNRNVENIIGRVTGSSPSIIEGLVNVRANFFLLNPNGIVLGDGAQIDVSGSLLLSTANRLDFEDGSFFDTDISKPLTLTMRLPVGLYIGRSSKNIQILKDSGNPFFDFQVGDSFLVLGNGVHFQNAVLSVPSRSVEIGSVSGPTVVGLDLSGDSPSLDFSDNNLLEDISFSNGSAINTSGFINGPIRLYGRRISFDNNSALAALNFGDMPGEDLDIVATESLVVRNFSSINSINLGENGIAGDINIDTKRLILSNASFIDSSSNGLGSSGDLNVKASELIEIRGDGAFSSLTSFSRGKKAGDIKLSTRRLVLLDGAQVNSTVTDGAIGNAGELTINASESINIIGQGVAANGQAVSSTLFSATTGLGTTGNGGDINVSTKRLSIQGGGNISVASTYGSQGRAGSIDIAASESVALQDPESTLSAESGSLLGAGNLSISTSDFSLEQGAQVSSSSTGSGPAGSLVVTAETIRLADLGSLSATTNSAEGNIKLKASSIFLLDNSAITTNAAEAATGGNIILNSDVIFAQNNSDITANATEGAGGLVELTAQGIFGLTPRTLADFENANIPADPALLSTSDVTAFSQLGGPTLSGTVIFQTPETDPSDGLIDLPVNVVDASQLVAQGCAPNGGVVASELSELIITGRGGLPTNPAQDLNNESVLTNWVVHNPQATSIIQSSALESPTISIASAPTSPQIIEAQGWKTNSEGQLMLTAESKTPPTAIVGLPANCQPS